MRFMPNKIKFPLIFILISLFIFISGFGVYFYLKNILTKETAREQQVDASSIKFILEQIQNNLENIAIQTTNLQIIQDYYSFGSYDQTVVEMLKNKIMALISEENLTTICLTDIDNVIMFYPTVEEAFSRPYFDKSLKDISNSGIESINGRLLVRGCAPVKNPITSRVVGTIIIGKYLEENDLLLSQLKKLQASNLESSLFTSDQLVIASSEAFSNSLAKSKLSFSVQRIYKTVLRLDDTDYLISMHPIFNSSEESIGSIVLGEPIHSSPITNFYFIIFPGIVLLILIGVSLWLSQKLTNDIDVPLIELSKNIKRVHKGEMKSRIQITSPQEIAEIGKRFNSVVTRISQMLREEQNRRHQIKKLNDTAKRISSEINLDTLLHLIMERVITVLEVDMCSLFLVNKDGVLENRVSGGSDTRPPSGEVMAQGENIAKRTMENERAEFINRLEEKFDLPRLPKRHTAIISAPLKNRGITLGVMNVFKNYDVNESTGFSDAEFNFLKALAGQASISVDNAILYAQVAEEERMQKELEITREIKQQIFPKKLPEIEGIEFAHELQQVKAAGGDYYDFIPQKDDKSIGLVMVDMAARGMQAAIITSIIRMTIRASAPFLVDPKKVVISIDEVLRENMSETVKFRITYALWECDTNTLTYSSAGQDSLITFQTNEGIKEQPFSKTNIGASSFSPDILKTERIKLNSGDAFILFSDGLVTAKNSERQWFGTGRLKDTFLESADLSAQEIKANLVEKLKDFTGGESQLDDLSFIVGKIK